jgi:MarR-like DNA-binding transcriptional regulator SgrR of sgrS sRNA
MAKDKDLEVGIIFIPLKEWNQMLRTLESIDRRMETVIRLERKQMAEIEDLQTTDLTGSVVALVNGLADQLEAAIANAQDPEAAAKVQAVVDQMRSNNQALADAVAANTEVNPL